MSKVTEKILDTIKAKKIVPKPKWQFLLKRWMIWVVTIISTLIGGFAISVFIFRLVNNDWEVIKYLNKSPAQHLFGTLPYVWLVLIVLFIGLAYYNARHTKGAYKYSTYWIMVGSILISLVLGGIFYAFGIAPRVNYVVQKLPFMKELMYDRDKIWMDVESGFLAGEITQMLSGIGMFELEDFEEKLWVIRPGDGYYPPPSDFVIEEGAMIRLYGEKIDDELFEAIKVMPYHIGPGMMKGMMKAGVRSRGKQIHLPYQK